jgi:hypothetical protein
LSQSKSLSHRLAIAGAIALSGAALALPSRAQDACGAGFDICFPNLDAGAPSACVAAEDDTDAAAIAACFADLCTSEVNEPEPGFFSYCCAAGGSVRYDDFCVLVVQTACPAVADACSDRCPPVELLTGTVPLAPPPAACIPSYPEFIADVCAADPFCCTTSWDELCAASALDASLAQ